MKSLCSVPDVFYHPFQITIKVKKHYKNYKTKLIHTEFCIVLFTYDFKVLLFLNGINANIYLKNRERLNITIYNTCFGKR